MTDRPIIFSAPMILALLHGRKTQSRCLTTSPLRKCRTGDRLWAKETFSVPYYMADITARDWISNIPIWYWADGNPDGGDWTKPASIHMSRRASRLTLIVTEVRTERLHDISAEDAIAEGLSWLGHFYGVPDIGGTWGEDPRESYFNLWRHDHGSESYDANPELVALTFTVHRANIDALPAEVAA